MCCQGFLLGFFQGCQVVLQGWEEGLPRGGYTLGSYLYNKENGETLVEL